MIDLWVCLIHFSVLEMNTKTFVNSDKTVITCPAYLIPCNRKARKKDNLDCNGDKVDKKEVAVKRVKMKNASIFTIILTNPQLLFSYRTQSSDLLCKSAEQINLSIG